MNWKKIFTWAPLFLIFILLFQNCNPHQFNSEQFELLIAGVRPNDGQVFDGKLRILHHLVDGFTCEGRPAPESVLYHDTDDSWHWIQNTFEKCAIDERTIDADLIDYNEALKTAIYAGKKYVPPLPYLVSASADANSIDVNTKDGICANSIGQCSLRAAVDQALPTALTTEVVVLVPPATYNLTNPLPLYFLSPDSNRVSIVGQDKTKTIFDAGFAVRHFSIHPVAGSQVDIQNLTLQRGRDNTALSGSSIAIEALYSPGSTAPGAKTKIINCIIQDNQNTDAVVLDPKAGSLVISSTQFINNQQNAVRFDSGESLEVTGSSIQDTSARGLTVYNNSDFVSIRESSFSNNYQGLRLHNCRRCILDQVTVFQNVDSGLELVSTTSDPLFAIQISNSNFYDNVTAPRANSVQANISVGFKDSTNSLTLTQTKLSMSGPTPQPNCEVWPSSFMNIIGSGNTISDSTCQ